MDGRERSNRRLKRLPNVNYHLFYRVLHDKMNEKENLREWVRALERSKGRVADYTRSESML